MNLNLYENIVIFPHPQEPGKHLWRTVHRVRRMDGATLSENSYDSASSSPWHYHPYPSLTLAVHGAVTNRFQGTSVESSVRKVMYHSANSVHMNRHSINARLFCIEFKPGELPVDDDYRFPVSPIPATALAGSEFLMNRLYREFHMPDACSDLAIRGLLLELLAWLAREEETGSQRPPNWLGRVIDRLNDGYQSSLTLNDLAVDAGVHPAHMSRTFRRYMRCGVIDYLRGLRCRRAVQLITTTSRSLADVAIEAGFSDQSQMTHAVRRVTGRTPGAWRSAM